MTGRVVFRFIHHSWEEEGNLGANRSQIGVYFEMEQLLWDGIGVRTCSRRGMGPGFAVLKSSAFFSLSFSMFFLEPHDRRRLAVVYCL